MSVLWLHLYKLTRDRVYRETANRALRFLKISAELPVK